MSTLAPSSANNEKPFPGFQVPNTTPIPDQLVDELLPILSGAEVKVVLYICRRTFGFKKQSDNISLNQMLRGVIRKDGRPLDGGVGLSKPTLLRALKSLREKQIIIAERRGSVERGNQPTNYRLHIVAPLGQTMSQGASQRLTKPLAKKATPQQTAGQETEKQQHKTPAPTSTDLPVTADPAVVVALVGEGLSKTVAQQLAGSHEKPVILEKIAYLHYLQAEKPDQIQNPRGWLRKAIEQDYGPPDGFVSEEERKRIAAEEKRREAAAAAARREAEMQIEQEKVLQAAQEALFAQQLAKEWGSGEQDLALWAQIKRVLQQQNFSPMLLADLRLLNVTDRAVNIGVSNQFIANQLEHPEIQKQLEHALQDLIKEPVKLAVHVVGSPQTALLTEEDCP